MNISAMFDKACNIAGYTIGITLLLLTVFLICYAALFRLGFVPVLSITFPALAL